MANESKPENVDDNSVNDGSKTTVSFTISSAPRSSQEDNSTASAVQDTTESKFFVPPWGTVFCIMASFGFFCTLALRVSLSVAIVAMVNQTAVSDDHVVTTNISDTDQCPRDQELERADGELTWDRHQQGTALAAFYYGLIVTQVIIANANNHKFCDRMVHIPRSYTRKPSKHLGKPVTTATTLRVRRPLMKKSTANQRTEHNVEKYIELNPQPSNC